MSLPDINKIFSMLQPKEDEEGEEEKRELKLAISQDNDHLLDDLLCQNRFYKFINSRSGWGIPATPLRQAVAQGHTKCVEVLLAHGAEVDCLDVKAQTPLFVAVNRGHLDCVRVLLAAGANPLGSIHNNCSPVLIAAKDGNVDILRELLDYGAEANAKSRGPDWAAKSVVCSGPLYLSAIYGHLECFKTLLLYGAEPNYNCNDEKMIGRIKNPTTLLEICLRHRCGVGFVKLLIDFGANVYLPIVTLDKIPANSEGLKLLFQEKAVPKSLMSQCRLAIRKFLNPPNQPNVVDKLEIPSVLIRYLKHQA